jgi:transcriptional regulator with XRE-family HTH domain
MDELSVREIFPKRLVYYMTINRKTRNDLVRDLGLKYSTVRDWEKGITIPRMGKVELLANYFNCKKSDLIEDKKEPADYYNDGLTQKRQAFIEKVKQMSEAELDRLDQILRIVESTK